MTEEKHNLSDFGNFTGDLADLEQIQAAVNAQKHARPLLETPYAPAQTPMEKELVEIWSDLLGMNQVGVNDNFFDLGGHSLLVTQLLSRIYDTFHVELPIETLFDAAPTVTELARAITQQQIDQADPDELAAELDALSGLSEDEIRALLSEDD
ncbi:MAG: phosphopantetheine-binding protein [Anaerolineales bacterium]